MYSLVHYPESLWRKGAEKTQRIRDQPIYPLWGAVYLL